MKTFSIAAAALLAASFSAMADTGAYLYPQVTIQGPSRSRAEVLAELTAARANNELSHGEFAFVAPPQGRSVSPAEVRAELAAARAGNELPYGEAFGGQMHGRNPASMMGAMGTGNQR